jgi:phytoene dehydrogenase-like protein
LNVAIVGAGMSGLCMAAKLQDAGIDTFTIFEQADEVGGTWRDNTYPGLSCDVPSRFYSYSFRPNPGWSRFMSPGPEIHSYFRQVATERGIRPHIRFGTEATSARYRDHRWWVGTEDGEEVFDVLITATGVLRVPRYPDIPGLDSFAGPSFSLRALGSLGFVTRQTDRIGRDGLHRRADHRGTRWKSTRAQNLSTHAAMGASRSERALFTIHQGGASALAHPEQGRLSVLAGLHRKCSGSRDGRTVLAAPADGGTMSP